MPLLVVIDKCAACARPGVARARGGRDLCYRHALAHLQAGGSLSFIRRRDAYRAAKEMGVPISDINRRGGR